MSDPLEVIDRYLDGTLTDAESEALGRWLDEDREHVATFIRLANVHSALRSTFLGQHDAQQHLGTAAAPRATRSGIRRFFARLVPLASVMRRPTPLSMTVATVVMCLLLTTMYFMVPPIYRSLAQRYRWDAPQPNDVVAVVTAAQEPVWRVGSPAAPPGTSLTTGRVLEIDSGFVEVTFQQGAVVALQGPCKLTVDRRDVGSLTDGKLLARVSSAARGFRIITPNAEIVDWGTEFGVAVVDDATQVVVLDGIVDVNAGHITQRLEQGEGLRLVSAADRVMWQPHWDQQLASKMTAVSRALTHRIVSTAQWGPVGTFKCSTIDLADQLQPAPASATLVAGTAGFSSHVAKLFDGQIYGDHDETISEESFTPRDGAVVEVEFDTTTNTAGYDLRVISSLTGTGQSRAIQHYRVDSREVGGQFERLFTVDESLANNVQRSFAGEVKVVTHRDGAPLATNVAALRFTFYDVKSAPQPEMMYREIDVSGKPSTMAEAAPTH